MDMNQYLDIFVEESREHLQILNTCLLELEKDPGATSMLGEIFRVAHTIKGMSGTMGFTRMQKLTHVMEDVLDAFRNNKLKANSDTVDVLFRCLDALESYTNQVVASGNEGSEEYPEVVEALVAIKNGSFLGKSKQKQADTLTPASSEVLTKVASQGTELSAPSPVKALSANLLALNMYDVSVLNKALQSGMNVLQIRVELDNGCLLKAARAFIIFQLLERTSQVLKSSPKVEDIEDERFDFHFTVIVVSKENAEFFEREINGVSEVKRVTSTELTSEMLVITEGSAQSAYELAENRAETEKITQAVEGGSSSKDVNASEEASKLKGQKTGKTVRVDIDRLDVLMNLVSELIIIKTRLADVKGSEVLSESVEYLERITTNLHDAVMKVRMVPVETVFNRFPRMIRDVARDLDKNVELHMSGEETELDRTVIDEIGDPLIHILRNSADHGLETRSDRLISGKSSAGNIWLRAFQDGNNVVIEVEDDGRGVNVQKVRQKIVERGLETREVTKSLSDKEVIAYLFKPSFSTADKVTDLSGRGVGLDVVKTKIEALGGMVELESKAGQGSKVVIRLPLTLAIIQALLVRVGSEKFAVPLGAIREIDNVSPSDIKTVRNQEVIMLRNTIIPIVRLDRVLGARGAIDDKQKKQLTVVIVRKGEKLSGFVVDGLIGQYEIVIKSLGKLLSSVRCIAGATILGDGNVALILDVNSLAL